MWFACVPSVPPFSYPGTPGPPRHLPPPAVPAVQPEGHGLPAAGGGPRGLRHPRLPRPGAGHAGGGHGTAPPRAAAPQRRAPPPHVPRPRAAGAAAGALVSSTSHAGAQHPMAAPPDPPTHPTPTLHQLEATAYKTLTGNKLADQQALLLLPKPAAGAGLAATPGAPLPILAPAPPSIATGATSPVARPLSFSPRYSSPSSPLSRSFDRVSPRGPGAWLMRSTAGALQLGSRSPPKCSSASLNQQRVHADSCQRRGLGPWWRLAKSLQWRPAAAARALHFV